MRNLLPLAILAPTMLFFSCRKEEPVPPKMNLVLKFDPTQERLGSDGQPESLPAGHAAQNPSFNGMSIHYIELIESPYTLPGQGVLLYHGAETAAGDSNAVDFDQALIKGDGETFLSIDLSEIPPGTYKYMRTSVTYQNYNVLFDINDVPVVGQLNNQQGTVASFVGFNNYISNLTVRAQTLAINDDHPQGFWAFETNLSSPYDSYNTTYTGQAPAGATTVPNPIIATSPIPPGSCLVTGEIVGDLVITGEEEGDVNIELSYSVNNSFEWQDIDSDGTWDVSTVEANNEPVMDMGLRGLKVLRK